MKKIDNKLLLGAGAVMLAAFLWSLDGVFIRPKFYEFPAALVVFLEHALGLIVLSPFIIYNWPKIKALSKKDWGAVIWVSVFGGLIGTIFITKAFFAAVHGEVTFATVIILQKLQPIFALVMARIILGEKLSRSFYAWASLAIAAAYVLSVGRFDFTIFNLNLISGAALFAFFAAFAFGSSTVLGKRLVSHLDFKTAAALRFALTSILALALIIVNNDILKLGELKIIHWQFLVLIVFSSGALAMFVYYYGLKRITASMATISELFWPISAVILDYIINKNVLNYVEIIASAVILFSFYKVVKSGRAKHYEFKASIVSGAGMGSRLGFPTINLDKTDIDIDHGVYLVDVQVAGNNELYKALMHFGPKVTFSNIISTELFVKKQVSISEKSELDVKIIKKLRNIKKFENKENLIKQIKKDILNL